MESERYPAKNREGRTDDFMIIQIEDSRGIQTFDPNSLMIAMFKGSLRLEETIGLSIISDTFGYRYSDSEVSMILTKPELIRLLEKDLKPEEYFKLRDKFGVFFLIHDDFYDEETGLSLQSMATRRAAML
jgi:hypothetical protein